MLLWLQLPDKRKPRYLLKRKLNTHSAVQRRHVTLLCMLVGEGVFYIPPRGISKLFFLFSLFCILLTRMKQCWLKRFDTLSIFFLMFIERLWITFHFLFLSGLFKSGQQFSKFPRYKKTLLSCSYFSTGNYKNKKKQYKLWISLSLFSFLQTDLVNFSTPKKSDFRFFHIKY